ncbi:hypothetical protein ACSPAH_10555 [Buttiauxella agrestis]
MDSKKTGGQIPKQHHYVYRKHLAPWTATQKTDGQIYCFKTDNGNIFSSNLTGVAQERYFYEYKKLTDLEKFFAYFISRVNDFEGKGNDLFIASIGPLCAVSKIEEIENHIDTSSRQNSEANVFYDIRRCLGEKAQGFYEDYGIDYLLQLLDDDISFFECENDCIRFSCYLLVQYSRTKKLRLKFKNSNKFSSEQLKILIERHGHELSLVNILFDREKAISELNTINSSLDLEKIHPYVLEGITFSVVNSLLARRKPTLQFINAPCGCEFLTGD